MYILGTFLRICLFYNKRDKSAYWKPSCEVYLAVYQRYDRSEQAQVLFQCSQQPFIFSFMCEDGGHLCVPHGYRNSSGLLARAVVFSSDWCLAEALLPGQVL